MIVTCGAPSERVAEDPCDGRNALWDVVPEQKLY